MSKKEINNNSTIKKKEVDLDYVNDLCKKYGYSLPDGVYQVFKNVKVTILRLVEKTEEFRFTGQLSLENFPLDLYVDDSDDCPNNKCHIIKYDYFELKIDYKK